MVVPFYGLDRFNLRYKESPEKPTSEIMASGHYSNKKDINSFELKSASHCHGKQAITVGGSTDALCFALIPLKLKSDDNVIVPGLSFIASVTPELRVGAVPVFADIDPVKVIQVFGSGGAVLEMWFSKFVA